MMKWINQGIKKDKTLTGFQIQGRTLTGFQTLLGLVIVVSTIFIGLRMKAFPLSAQASHLEKELRPRAALTDNVESLIPFLIDSLCQITDPTHSLDAFLEELNMLLAGKDTVIQIVHLGDSHVQAGLYSGQVMRMLQHAFGNAGRGWIAPLKLAKINEPRDYYITSPAVKDWIAGRCIQPAPKCIWGLGGLGIQTASKTIDFSVSITPVNGAGYDFNKVLLFRDDKAIPLLPAGADSLTTLTAWGSDIGAPRIAVDTFRIDNQTNSLYLRAVSQRDLQEGFSTNSFRHAVLDTASLDSIPFRLQKIFEPEIWQTPNCYYGFSLMNGKSGILYHSIGQNGAMFSHFTSSDYMRQLALLQPSLLIVTLGTNEAFTTQNYIETKFLSQVDDFIQLVKEYLPATAILLTTPAECFRRTRNGYVRNERISLVAKEITEYAQREGLACFDLYGMTGGANSCNKWQETKLLGSDRIHFSVDGYLEQGKLLYKAIVRLVVGETRTGEPELSPNGKMGEAGEIEEMGDIESSSGGEIGEIMNS